MLLVAGACVRLNISVVEEYLLILDAGKRIAEIGEASSNRFYLGTGQADAGLELF